LNNSDLTGFSFTDCARRVFERARDEAVRLRHEYFEAEHIFLGLLGTPDGAAAAALDSVNTDRAAVRSRIETMFPVGSEPVDRGELPYGSTGLALLRNAMTEARDSGSDVVSSAHVLLGALASREEAPWQVLDSAGVSISDLEAALRAHPADSE
jgi:ATP-dependent Clp protease ATP-binding subunit ClpA